MPNMGEKERGIPDGVPASKVKKASSHPLSEAASTPTSSSQNPILPNNSADGAQSARTGAVARLPNSGTSAMSWSQVMWEKWRWGALILFAVVLSRMSSHP